MLWPSPQAEDLTNKRRTSPKGRTSKHFNIDWTTCLPSEISFASGVESGVQGAKKNGLGWRRCVHGDDDGSRDGHDVRTISIVPIKKPSMNITAITAATAPKAPPATLTSSCFVVETVRAAATMTLWKGNHRTRPAEAAGSGFFHTSAYPQTHPADDVGEQKSLTRQTSIAYSSVHGEIARPAGAGMSHRTGRHLKRSKCG
jgi:hypothetical protein